jgi:hypothetical protein
MRFRAWPAYNVLDMKEWGFAQNRAEEQLSEVHTFSMMKQQAGGEIEFLITVKEYVTPREPTMHFFAQADKMTNQHTAPYRPCGWGKTMLEALSECVRAVNRFPYEAS